MEHNMHKKYRIDWEHGPEAMYHMTKREFPNQTKEFYQFMTQERWRYSVRCAYQRFISDKLKKTGVYGSHEADNIASDIIKDLLEELFHNVEEWLNDEPISEIKYGDLSIKELMDFGKDRRGRQNGFLECIELMILYIQDRCKDKHGCYRALRW